MSATYHKIRRARVVSLAWVAGALWVILAAAGLTRPSASLTHANMGNPVLADFTETRIDTHRIRFILADETYTLERTSAGWVMQETGGYPVRQDRLAALAGGLETLAFDEKRTADPYKHDRIGLGDPTEDGNGALVEIFDQDDRLLHSLIIGRKDDRIYMRAPSDDQTYRTVGDLPPFYNRRAWLNLNIIEIEPSAIQSVRLEDRNGRSLYLRRGAGEGARSFAPAPPYQDDTIVSRLAASTTALAITRLAPFDVRPASTLSGDPIARHISETFDGLEIEILAHDDGVDGQWVTLRAVEAGEGARRAKAINGQAQGWAFRINDYDFQDFTPDVLTIVER
ncbi:MAG: DUF4340 domain-containing protein [Pseudomonadota bacterium]